MVPADQRDYVSPKNMKEEQTKTGIEFNLGYSRHQKKPSLTEWMKSFIKIPIFDVFKEDVYEFIYLEDKTKAK